jgi:hypothetical protein
MLKLFHGGSCQRLDARGPQINGARGSCRHGDKIGLEKGDELQPRSAGGDHISGIPLKGGRLPGASGEQGASLNDFEMVEQEAQCLLPNWRSFRSRNAGSGTN